MNRILKELKAGWNDIRWIGLFSIYLLITTSFAVLVAYAFDGNFADTPSPMQILLVSLGGLFSLYLSLSQTKTMPGYETDSNSDISHAPGFVLLKIANLIYDRKTVQKVFEPMIFDFQAEYFEAVNYNKKIKVTMISLVFYFQIFIIMIQKSPLGDFFSFVKKRVK